MPEDPELNGEIPLEISAETDSELLQEFLNDARDHLDHIEQGVLVLEEDAHNQEVVNTIFRAFHTFKGNAGFLDLTAVSELAHVLESLLDQVREGHLEINSAIIEIILKGRDTLKQFVDEIEAQVRGKKTRRPLLIPTSALKASVRRILDGDESATCDIPALKSSVPEESAETAPVEPPAPVEPSANAKSPLLAGNENNSVKVSTAKLDSLVDLAGELLIAQSLIVQIASSSTFDSHALMRNLSQLNRISKELQRTAMTMRMVPIRGIFQKMHRLVRDVAARQKKEVHLVLEGEDTEVDRTLVEKLSDPLMHMVRNAVDHAIEPMAQRIAAGKPAAGRILLRAYHKSGHILIEVEDDGAGLNRERIVQKAIRNGLLKPGVVPEDKDIFSLIFHPGFSTAEVVTDISGRGVGMDVVQRNISKLRGKIDIRSAPGVGTGFTIQLPLTMAIIDGLIIKVSGQRYILPAISVRESFHPKSCHITSLPGRGEVVQMRKELIPLLRLHDHFQFQTASTYTGAGIMVVIEADGQKRCLLADELLGKQEVVIKHLGDVFKTDPMISGGAILGDGCVGLILDPTALVRLENPGQEILNLAA